MRCALVCGACASSFVLLGHCLFIGSRWCLVAQTKWDETRLRNDSWALFAEARAVDADDAKHFAYAKQSGCKCVLCISIRSRLRKHYNRIHCETNLSRAQLCRKLAVKINCPPQFGNKHLNMLFKIHLVREHTHTVRPVEFANKTKKRNRKSKSEHE